MFSVFEMIVQVTTKGRNGCLKFDKWLSKLVNNIAL